MAVKKISELPAAGSGDITPDDVLILNDGSITKKTTITDFFIGSEELDANFNNLVLTGNLTVQGTTTTVNSEEVALADNTIVLNSNFTGSSPTENAGIIVNRDSAGNKSLVWNETTDKWTIGTETFAAGTFEGNLIGNVTGTVSDISNFTTDNITEGTTNTYYSDSQVDNYLSGGTGVTYNSGEISIGQSVGISDTVTFASVTAPITGNVKSVSNGNILVNATANTIFLSNNSTDDLPQGTTNLYYTDSLVDSHLSGGTGVTYSLGEISIGQSVNTSDDVTFNTVSAVSVTSDFVGSVFANNNTEMIDAVAANLNLSNNTADDLPEGITNVYYKNSLVDNHLTGGVGVSYSQGEISIGQDVSPTADVTFNDVLVNGDFTVNGTTTTVNTETINLSDNIILLNSDYSGDSPSQSSGIEINRGTQPNKTFLWDEVNDRWSAGTESISATTFIGNVDGQVNDISNFTSDDVVEGTSNLYFTNAQARAAFSATGDIVYDQANGIFSFTERSDSEIRLLVSAIGDLNYDFNTGIFSYNISNNTTDDLPEGASNKYYSNILVDAHLTGGTGVTYSSGIVSIGQDVSTSANVSFNKVTGVLAGNVESTADSTVLVDATNNILYLNGNTTDDLPEGASNKYYTDSLVENYLSGGTGVTYNSGVISIGQDVNVDSNVTFSSVTSSVFTGNFIGSVFADDSTVLVDGINGVIPGYVAVATLKDIVAASTDFADFQTRIANDL